MAAKTLLRSFSGGEVTPEMFGRIDVSKFQTGLQRALNFITLPHGPAARRPGTRFGAEAKDSTQAVRLVPFVFAADQAIVLEFGHLYVRFHTADGALLTAAQAIVDVSTAADAVFEVTGHGFVNGGWVFLTSAGILAPYSGRFFIVNSVTTDTFKLTTLDGVAVDTSALGVYAPGSTVEGVYTVTTPYDADDIFRMHFAQNADVLTLVHPDYAARELRRLGSTNWQLSTVSFAPTLSAPTGLAVVDTEPVSGDQTPQDYKVTSVAADGVTESFPTASVGTTNALALVGNFNTVSWNAAAGADRYNVYKQRGGAFGYIGQTTDLEIIDDNILPDTTVTPPEDIIALNGSAGEYPSSVVYYEQRRWFGGTANSPQTIYATRSATEANLTSSIPSRDDDALEFRIAAQQQNTVRHLLPLSDLIALTTGGEWRIFSDGAPAITPTSLSVRPQGYSGAADVQPALTSGSALYVQAQGSRVRELAYDPQGTGFYRSIDISIMAPHLFNGYTLVDMAYTRAPDQILWAVRSDGKMLGLTYVPDQQVYGWHQHETDGYIESCAVIPEGNEDTLYVVVRRTVDGRSVRYIERLASRLFAAAEDAFFVDSGLTYDGAPVTTLTGLHHLEGMDVDALADGAVVPRQTVTNGAITLGTAASVVHVGLPFTSDLQTLPLSFEGSRLGAAGQGTMKNVNKVHLRVANSSLVKAGPAFDKLTAFPPRAVSDPYGSPPALRNGEIGLVIGPSWDTDGAVCVRQDEPLPLTVLSMTLEVAIGG